MPNATILATEPAPAELTAAPTTEPATQELLNAIRSLFTCTRKVRSWVADAGPMTVLGVVAEHGEARVSTVATALLVDVSTVSRSLAALCKEGLVQWRADESDLRSHLVSCTPAGLTRLGERRDQMGRELDRRLDDWPETEVAELSRLLNRFVASLLTEPDADPEDAPRSPSTLSLSTRPTSTAKESA